MHREVRQVGDHEIELAEFPCSNKEHTVTWSEWQATVWRNQPGGSKLLVKACKPTRDFEESAAKAREWLEALSAEVAPGLVEDF